MSAEKRLRERLSTIVQLLDTLDEMIETSYDVKFLDDWKLACIELGIDHTMEPHRAVRQWATRVVRLADLPDAEHIHLTRLPDGRWTAEDADDRLRNAIAAHRYLGSLDVMRPIYDTLPVQMRSIVMHVMGEHDDPIGCYEHCALCIAVRSPRNPATKEPPA